MLRLRLLLLAGLRRPFEIVEKMKSLPHHQGAVTMRARGMKQGLISW